MVLKKGGPEMKKRLRELGIVLLSMTACAPMPRIFGSKQMGLGNSQVYSLASSLGGTIIAGTDRGFYKSTDYGFHWTNANLTNTDVFSLLIGSDDRFFAGTDSGVYISTDAGGTWLSSGLSGIQVYSLCVDSLGNLKSLL